ncbi:acetate CoA/acetoacetate CoA-transferase alpha subunit [Cohaesibacter sp. ES.047]|uniref:CoA transferase subunit A n=1 Tax=Cohaesibacter sp. ES.047 TaxID=1798205 RepID=UPI000BB73EE4|nr:CoA transferase subunit A [Cohaesibacter sp. ES.047]SNY89925.1 acetate CoA/acetoacetate CoA-transferase alpha subunit [Cohaesibacter sp. ES.047]
MRLPAKSTTIEEAIANVRDGATVMVGGFGVPGTPFNLIAELVRQGPRHLTLVKNDANEKGMGIDHLLAAGQVDKLIVTHLGLNANAIAMMNEGRLEVEFCAQGILAERIRSGGSGLAGFLTDIAIGTELGAGKKQVEIEGVPYLFEPSLRADVSLVHAESADLVGNLCFAKTARNFNPLMAMASDCVIAESVNLLPVGGLEPDVIHVPSPFVDHVVPIDQLHEEYAIVRR